jgi:hypothetical protein
VNISKFSIDFSSGYTDYSIAFYISAGFVVILMPIIYRLEIDVQKNKQSIISTAKRVIGMIDVDVFLLVEIFVGACELCLKVFLVPPFILNKALITM